MKEAIMTKVKIDPGICGLTTMVEAQADEDLLEVTLSVQSDCEAITKMMEALGNTFEAMPLCLSTPGDNPLAEYSREHFPVHAACPVLSGILKCAEAECELALPKDSSIVFLHD